CEMDFRLPVTISQDFTRIAPTCPRRCSPPRPLGAVHVLAEPLPSRETTRATLLPWVALPERRHSSLPGLRAILPVHPPDRRRRCGDQRPVAGLLRGLKLPLQASPVVLDVPVAGRHLRREAGQQAAEGPVALSPQLRLDVEAQEDLLAHAGVGGHLAAGLFLL